jgi:hypothetical protein
MNARDAFANPTWATANEADVALAMWLSVGMEGHTPPLDGNEILSVMQRGVEYTTTDLRNKIELNGRSCELRDIRYAASRLINARRVEREHVGGVLVYRLIG